MNTAEEYVLLCKNLKSMTEEYKLLPSKFLEKKINLVQDKLRAIDKSIPKKS